MRIVGGALSGRKLATPSAGSEIRPTSDRVREALFNLLAHGPYPALEGARALDLFAGSGALGCEALSRGAARAVFVDESPKARALIRQNVEALALVGCTKIFRRDATRLGENRLGAFDLIFLDPPYGRGLGERAIASALAGGWIAPGAAIVLEERTGAAPEAPPAPFALADQRRYGDTTISILTQDA